MADGKHPPGFAEYMHNWQCYSRLRVRVSMATSSGCGKDIARGPAVRHDHGSQYMSDHFQKEIAFLGIEKATRPSSVHPRVTVVPSGSSAHPGKPVVHDLETTE